MTKNDSLVVGIEIERDYIKLVEVKKHPTKLVKIMHSTMQHLSKENYEEDLKIFLKREINWWKRKRAKINISLPRNEIFIRQFNIPPVPSQHFKDAVYYELIKYLPTTMGELAFQYKVYQVEKQHFVTAVVVKKDRLNWYVGLFKDIGIEIDKIVCNYDALEALHRMSFDNLEPGTVLVDVNEDRLELIGMDREGFPLYYQTHVIDQIKENIDELTQKIQEFINYARSVNRLIKLQKVVLVGITKDTITLKKLEDKLLGATVRILVPKTERNAQSVKNSVALGLALGNFTQDLLDKRPEIGSNRIKDALMISGLTVLIVLIMSYAQNRELGKAKKYLAVLEQKMNVYTPWLEKGRENQQTYKKLLQKYHKLQEARTNGELYLQAWNEIVKRIPEGTRIDTLYFEGKRLEELSGSSDSAVAVLTHLKKAALFKNLEFDGSVTVDKQDELKENFRIAGSLVLAKKAGKADENINK